MKLAGKEVFENKTYNIRYSAFPSDKVGNQPIRKTKWGLGTISKDNWNEYRVTLEELPFLWLYLSDSHILEVREIAT